MNKSLLTSSPGQGWRLRGWGGRQIIAAITDRHTTSAALLSGARGCRARICADQVHGASIAMVDRPTDMTIPGCDALLTAIPGVALIIRTADCLPLFFAEPGHGVVGLAHAGWHGLAAGVPMRVVAALRSRWGIAPSQLRVAVGPAIHACCYEVGAEFEQRFPRFIHRDGTQRRCDLIGVAREQLVACGLRPARISDVDACTACDPGRWFSLRREGQDTGRLSAVIMLTP